MAGIKNIPIVVEVNSPSSIKRFLAEYIKRNERGVARSDISGYNQLFDLGKVYVQLYFEEKGEYRPAQEYFVNKLANYLSQVEMKSSIGIASDFLDWFGFTTKTLSAVSPQAGKVDYSSLPLNLFVENIQYSFDFLSGGVETLNFTLKLPVLTFDARQMYTSYLFDPSGDKSPLFPTLFQRVKIEYGYLDSENLENKRVVAKEFYISKLPEFEYESSLSYIKLSYTAISIPPIHERLYRRASEGAKSISGSGETQAENTPEENILKAIAAEIYTDGEGKGEKGVIDFGTLYGRYINYVFVKWQGGAYVPQKVRIICSVEETKNKIESILKQKITNPTARRKSDGEKSNKSQQQKNQSGLSDEELLRELQSVFKYPSNTSTIEELFHEYLIPPLVWGLNKLTQRSENDETKSYYVGNYRFAKSSENGKNFDVLEIYVYSTFDLIEGNLVKRLNDTLFFIFTPAVDFGQIVYLNDVYVFPSGRSISRGDSDYFRLITLPIENFSISDNLRNLWGLIYPLFLPREIGERNESGVKKAIPQPSIGLPLKGITIDTVFNPYIEIMDFVYIDPMHIPFYSGLGLVAGISHNLLDDLTTSISLLWFYSPFEQGRKEDKGIQIGAAVSRG